MSVMKRMRKQKVCYWEPTEPDRYGNMGFKPPVEIKCRWQSASKEEKDTLALEVDVTDVVYPDRELKIGGMLWEGLKKDLPKLTPPPADAKRIQGAGKIPNFKYTETLYIAGL